MGKLKREAKDETAGIVGGRWWRFDCEDRQTEKCWVVSLVFLSLVVRLAAA
jgi:hypothetical protein